MPFRLLAIWLCTATAIWVDFFLWMASFALRTRNAELFHGKPLPALTEWFLPPDFNYAAPWPTWPYYFPLLIVGASALMTWRHRHDTEKTVLFCVSALALTLGFLAIFFCAMTMPFVTIVTALHS